MRLNARRIALGPALLVAISLLTAGCGEDKASGEAKPEKVAKEEKKDEAKDDEKKDEAKDDNQDEAKGDDGDKKAADKDKKIAELQKQLEEAKKAAEAKTNATTEAKPAAGAGGAQAAAAAAAAAAKTAAGAGAPPAGGAAAAPAAGGDACAAITTCCAEVAKTVPALSQACGALQQGISMAPAGSKGMVCEQGIKTLRTALASVPNAPASCTGKPAAAAAAATPAAPNTGTTPTPAAPAGGDCAKLDKCCADAKASSPIVAQVCNSLKTAMAQVPEASKGMICTQGMKTLARSVAAVPNAPASCTGKPAAAAPAAAAAGATPATGGTATPTPGTTPAAPNTGDGTAPAVISDACPRAKSCCASLQSQMPQVGKLCESMRAATTPEQCTPVFLGLQAAAGAMPQLGKSVPNGCK